MDCTTDRAAGGHGAFPASFVALPSSMPGFEQTAPCRESSRRVNMGTARAPRAREVPLLVVPGATLEPPPSSCPSCGAPTRRNGSSLCSLAHLPLGGSWVRVEVERARSRCTACGASFSAPVPFRAEGHMATGALVAFCGDLLARGLNLKEVSLATGLCAQVVREVDRARLERLYTVEGAGGDRGLARPARRARLPGVGEFKLHDGHCYTTVAVDLDTGHVLWLARGRKKTCLHAFFGHVGEGWMAGVEAVACDTDSDYGEAFREGFPRVAVVFDRSRIVRNLNDGVISEVRKGARRRLREAGDEEGARSLKCMKCLLMAGAATRAARGVGAAPPRRRRRPSSSPARPAPDGGRAPSRRRATGSSSSPTGRPWPRTWSRRPSSWPAPRRTGRRCARGSRASAGRAARPATPTSGGSRGCRGPAWAASVPTRASPYPAAGSRGPTT